MRLPHLVAAMLAATSLLPHDVTAQRAPQSSDSAAMVRALHVLTAAPVADGHNDLPWAIRERAHGDVAAYDIRGHVAGMTDLPRLRAGHVGLQFWSVYIPGERDAPIYARNGDVSSTPGYARAQLEQIDIALRMIARYPDALTLVRTAAGARAAMRKGKIASLLGVEGGHAIENSLGVLRTYYDLGVRYMTLTHNVTLDWADAALDSARHHGLTPFGREVVREMNRLGMLVDLAHVSPATMSDALDVSAAPVIFSHSSARALTDVARNVPDSILRRVRANGGVVMVTFVPEFVSSEVARWAAERDVAGREARAAAGGDSAAVRKAMAEWRAAHPAPRATLAQVADHIEHVRDVAGVDHVGLGGDFDGIETAPVGLEDVSTYPALVAELVRRGWSDADLEKLTSGNVLRVLEEAERVAGRLRAERPPSTATLGELDGKPPHGSMK